MKRLIIATSALGVMIGLSACGASTTTVSGNVQVTGAGDCNPGQLPAGIQPETTQVTVISPSGTVLGSTYLGKPSSAGNALGLPLCNLPFRVTSVPSNSMYGVKISGVSGTSWAHKATGIVISVTEGS
jgi:hypothetical protein